MPASEPETREEDSVLRVYNRIRSYIEHEDKLINDRISRTLLVHGFLLASGVLLVQSRVEAAAKCMGRDQGCWPEAPASNAHLLAPEQLSIVLLLVDVLLPVIAMIGVVTTRAGAGWCRGSRRVGHKRASALAKVRFRAPRRNRSSASAWRHRWRIGEGGGERARLLDQPLASSLRSLVSHFPSERRSRLRVALASHQELALHW